MTRNQAFSLAPMTYEATDRSSGVFPAAAPAPRWAPAVHLPAERAIVLLQRLAAGVIEAEPDGAASHALAQAWLDLRRVVLGHMKMDAVLVREVRSDARLASLLPAHPESARTWAQARVADRREHLLARLAAEIGERAGLGALAGGLDERGARKAREALATVEALTRIPGVAEARWSCPPASGGVERTSRG